jgi:hypothetical protein
MRAAMPAAPASTPAKPGARVGAAKALAVLLAAALDEALLAAEELDDRTLATAEEALLATDEDWAAASTAMERTAARENFILNGSLVCVCLLLTVEVVG